MAKQSGADIVSDLKLINKIAEDKIDFDVLYTTPNHLPALKPYARVLGPKGLFPNLKSGTLIESD